MLSYRTLKSYGSNMRSLPDYKNNEFNLIKDVDFDQSQEFKNLNNTHIHLTNNLTKYGIDLCNEFVKIFENMSAGVNHCLLLKKVAKKFIDEGVKAINLGMHVNTRKICIESSVQLLKRNINVLSAYFIKLKTFNEVDKEDMKTYLGEFFDENDDISDQNTNKVAQIIKDGENKINSIVETKPTEVKEVEDFLVEFEQMREKLSDTIGTETDLIYDQSVILKFINRLSKVDIYLKNHIHVLKSTSEGSSIEFDVLESSEEKEAQKIKHPKTGELKDKKEGTKTLDETKEPEKISLSNTKISIIIIGSLMIFVVLVIVAIIFFKKYRKNRGQTNNFINLENTLSMYVTNEK